MQEKLPHIVFQVLNYIFTDPAYDNRLLPVHRLLLIALAKHHGLKGIYPSTRTLAKELHVTPRYIKICLNFLESIKIIRIERKNGCSSNYFLEFLSTDRGTTVHPCSTDHRGTTVHPTGELQFRNRGTTVHPISINNQQRLNNTEGRRTQRATTLPDDFEPNDKSVAVAKGLGLNKAACCEEFDRFIDYYTENGQKKKDWQLVLQNWFRRGAGWKKNTPVVNDSGTGQLQVRSTVPWFNGDPLQGRGDPMAVASLLNGLAAQAREHMDARSTNGLETGGKGKAKKAF